MFLMNQRALLQLLLQCLVTLALVGLERAGMDVVQTAAAASSLLSCTWKRAAAAADLVTMTSGT